MQTPFRKSMAWLHTWVGLIFCWVMYFMFVTGTLGYFDEEIDQYMTPELPHQVDVSLETQISSLIDYASENAEGATFWLLHPSYLRGGNLARLNASFPAENEESRPKRISVTIDPSTGGSLEGIARETGGGQLLYKMHWRLHYMDRTVGYYIIGIVTVFMFLGVITGIIIHRKIFRDLFTFRTNNGMRGWLDMHNLMSVSSLPFQLMISYSGLVFVASLYFPGMIAGSFGYDIPSAREQSSAITNSIEVIPSGQKADTVSAQVLLKSMSAELPLDKLRQIRIDYPEDKNAMISVSTLENIFVRGADRYIFNAITGEFIERLDRVKYAGIDLNFTLVDLHEGLFAGIGLRWFYFLAGVLGAGMIATGCIYYVKKRLSKMKRENIIPRYLKNIDSANIATIVGLLASVAMFFIANRLLPIETTNRAEWEVHIMFMTWVLCFLHAYRRPAIKAWTEQLYFAGGLFVFLPLLNMIFLEVNLISSLKVDNKVSTGIDLFSLFFGITLIGTAAFVQNRRYRLRKNMILSKA